MNNTYNIIRRFLYVVCGAIIGGFILALLHGVGLIIGGILGGAFGFLFSFSGFSGESGVDENATNKTELLALIAVIAVALAGSVLFFHRNTERAIITSIEMIDPYGAMIGESLQEDLTVAGLNVSLDDEDFFLYRNDGTYKKAEIYLQKLNESEKGEGEKTKVGELNLSLEDKTYKEGVFCLITENTADGDRAILYAKQFNAATNGSKPLITAAETLSFNLGTFRDGIEVYDELYPQMQKLKSDKSYNIIYFADGKYFDDSSTKYAISVVFRSGDGN